jgi:hypothetical protein
MTYIEILDTTIKIGLGAFITGLLAYFNQKANHKATISKDRLEYSRKLLTTISADVEDISHLILKMWSIFEFETKKESIDKEQLLLRLKPLRNKLFDDFKLLSKSEGLLLLHGYNDQQEKLRFFGELLGKFNTYTSFKNDLVDVTTTSQYREKILEARKDLYKSLNTVMSE